MSDRVEYIRRRLDQLEAAANAARPGPWRIAENEWDGKHIAAADGEAVMGVYGFGVDDPYAAPNSEHIALSDPAAVLARVAADRKTLDLCVDALHEHEAGVDPVAAETVRLLAEGLGYAGTSSGE